MNTKLNRHVLSVSNKVVRLQAEVVKLQEKKVAMVLLQRRQEEIERLKETIGQ